MRVIVFVLVVIAGVGLYVATTDRESEISSPLLPVPPPVVEVLPEPENQGALRPFEKVLPEPENQGALRPFEKVPAQPEEPASVVFGFAETAFLSAL